MAFNPLTSDPGLQNLLDQKYIYPTPPVHSYIQQADRNATFGIIDLQFPGQGLLLCGKGPTQNQVSGISFFKEKLNSIYDSAKNVFLPQDYPLPWENDTRGLLFDSPIEMLEEKIKYLAILSRYVLLGEHLVKFDASDPEHVKALPHFFAPDKLPQPVFPLPANIFELLAEYHLLKAEKQFREKLRKWMEGMAPPYEYPEDVINWAPHEVYNKAKNLLNPYTPLKDQLNQAEKTFGIESQRYLKMKDFSEKVRLNNVNPTISQGFILNEDILKWKTNTFLEILKKTPPKNDTEAYLFYKYIILKKEPNFDYLYGNVPGTHPNLSNNNNNDNYYQADGQGQGEWGDEWEEQRSQKRKSYTRRSNAARRLNGVFPRNYSNVGTHSNREGSPEEIPLVNKRITEGGGNFTAPTTNNNNAPSSTSPSSSPSHTNTNSVTPSTTSPSSPPSSEGPPSSPIFPETGNIPSSPNTTNTSNTSNTNTPINTPTKPYEPTTNVIQQIQGQKKKKHKKKT